MCPPTNNTNQDRGANAMSLKVIKNLLCFLCGDVMFEILWYFIAVLIMDEEMPHATDVIIFYFATMMVLIPLLTLLESCVKKKESTKQSRTFCYYFKCAVKYTFHLVCLIAGIVMEYAGWGVAGLISWCIDVFRAYKHGNIDWSQVVLIILVVIIFLVAIGIISILEYSCRKRSSEENAPEQKRLNDTGTKV